MIMTTDPTVSGPATKPEYRLHELDSLRGLAAATVVFYHYYLGALLVAHPSLWQVWSLKFLYPFYAGHQAVRLFFVLSGLVLALPYLKNQDRSYLVFLIRRITRIYGPYLVALMLAVSGAAIWHGNLGYAGLAHCCWSEPVSSSLVLHHIMFLGVYDFGQYDAVVWSLIHELRISIIFPFLFLIIHRISFVKSITIAGMCSLSAMLILRSQVKEVHPFPEISIVMTLHYVALFIMGILVAMHLANISRWYKSLRGSTVIVFSVLSFVLYEATGLLVQTLVASHRLVLELAGDWGTALGAIGIIITALNSTYLRKLLGMTVPVFLGRISYSLYLTHIPLLLAIAFMFHGNLSNIGTVFPFYVAAALALAYIFCILVEEPFMRAGRSFKLPLKKSDTSSTKPKASVAVT
jgi:peptidoglycan/LPS O-acetylase OafA/YrhL